MNHFDIIKNCNMGNIGTFYNNNNVNSFSDDYSKWIPLYAAISLGRVDLTGYLLSIGANPDTKVKEGTQEFSPLLKAISINSIGIVKDLLDHNVTLSYSNYRGVFYAIGYSKLEILKVLLDSIGKVDPLIVNESGRSFLCDSIAGANIDTTELLLNYVDVKKEVEHDNRINSLLSQIVNSGNPRWIKVFNIVNKKKYGKGR